MSTIFDGTTRQIVTKDPGLTGGHRMESISVGAGSAFSTLGVAVGVAAVQVTAASTPLVFGVQVKAAAANTGKIYVGAASTVTAGTAPATAGYELSAGGSVLVPIDNVNKAWAMA